MGNSLCSGTTVLNNNFRLQKMLVLYYIQMVTYIAQWFGILKYHFDYTPHCNIHNEIYIYHLYTIYIYHLYIPSIYTTLTIYTPHCNIHKEIYIHTTTIVNRRRN